MPNSRLLLLAALLPLSAQAQEIGDATAGARFAKEICAECHAVGTRQENSPDKDAPPFTHVATTPGMNERALAVWLQSPHPTMPNIILEKKDRDDIVAYIVSLKPVPPQ